MLKKNDIIELEINSITNLGFGVGRHGGLVVFVSGLVTGDFARVRIIKITSSYAVGKTEKLIRRSEKRCEDRCPVSTCTSCAYRLLDYESELSLKENDVREAFLKAGLADVCVARVIPSPKRERYRNKAQYPVSMDKNGDYVIGFYAPKSHRVTEARKCPLAPEVFSEIIDIIADFFKEERISVYDEQTGKGLIRHIYLRRGEISGEILVTLVINGDTLPNCDALVRRLTETNKEIVGLVLNINKRDTNVILGESFKLVYGRDYIYDTLAGVELKITAPSFYQVNHGGAEILYAKARELAKPTKDDLVLDLYCGTGSIGLSMAKNAKELIGIEIVDSAVECAKENAKRQGIENAHFFVGDAKNTENLLKRAEAELGRKIKPSVVLLDPPRAGCDKALIEFVSSLSPKRIVYISCNPTTLARDCAAFKLLGYECGKVTPVDMFCMAGHVESVVCLTRTFDN